MRLLVTLLVLSACLLAFVVLLPILGLLFAIAWPIGWLVIWLLPIVIIVLSNRVTTGEKLACILLIVFFSWFAWVFYFLLAPIKPRLTRDRHYRGYRYD